MFLMLLQLKDMEKKLIEARKLNAKGQTAQGQAKDAPRGQHCKL